MQLWHLARSRVAYILVISHYCFCWLVTTYVLSRLIHLMMNLRSWLGWALKRYLSALS
jgi:hypothetical protein